MNIRFWRSAVAVLAAVLVFGGLSATSASASYKPDSNTLYAGHTLKAGQWLLSSDASYAAFMLDDGNFAVYGPHGHGWSTGPSSANRIVMQGDGNLVSYNTNHKAIYASRTNPSKNDRLVMQSDGNLVIYSGCHALWSNGVRLPKKPCCRCR